LQGLKFDLKINHRVLIEHGFDFGGQWSQGKNACGGKSDKKKG
jgi:hypothetical protein